MPSPVLITSLSFYGGGHYDSILPVDAVVNLAPCDIEEAAIAALARKNVSFV